MLAMCLEPWLAAHLQSLNSVLCRGSQGARALQQLQTKLLWPGHCLQGPGRTTLSWHACIMHDMLSQSQLAGTRWWGAVHDGLIWWLAKPDCRSRPMSGGLSTYNGLASVISQSGVYL